MSPTTRKVLDLKNLKLKLVMRYKKEGRAGIIKLLEENEQVAYLKRHKLFNPTVLDAENMCKQTIHEELITNQN